MLFFIFLWTYPFVSKISCNSPVEKLNNFLNVFSKTPLFVLSYTYNGKKRTIYGKYDAVSPTFSVKGRMVFYVLKRSFELGLIKFSDTIVEVTSGNTGIALTTAGNLIGNKVELLMPSDVGKDKQKLIKFLGANLHTTCPAKEGGFAKCFELAEEKSKQNGYFYLRQFENPLNIECHEKMTAPEFYSQIAQYNLDIPKIFVAGVGSAGITMGFSKYIRSNNIATKVLALEPAQAPIITNHGKNAELHHRIEGINDNILPKLFDYNLCDEIINADDGDVILMCQKLAKAGISCGLPSGANVVGIVKYLDKFDEDNLCAATMFCDSAERYISSYITNEEKMQDNYVSKTLQIENVNIIN